jgi:hypothetical protein
VTRHRLEDNITSEKTGTWTAFIWLRKGLVAVSCAEGNETMVPLKAENIFGQLSGFSR